MGLVLPQPAHRLHSKTCNETEHLTMFIVDESSTPDSINIWFEGKSQRIGFRMKLDDLRQAIEDRA